MASRLQRCAILLLVVVAAIFAAIPAFAVEMGPGTKNFTPPRGVPNYFNNEAEPFLGGPETPETGYSRGFVSGRTSRHYAASRRGGYYRGRAVSARGRIVVVRGRRVATGRFVAVRGRPAGRAATRAATRTATRTIVRPAPRGRVATRAVARPASRGTMQRPVPRTAVHAIRAVYTGHGEGSLTGVRTLHRVDGVRPTPRSDGTRAVHHVDGVRAIRGARPASAAGAVHRVSGRAAVQSRAPPARRRS